MCKQLAGKERELERSQTEMQQAAKSLATAEAQIGKLQLSLRQSQQDKDVFRAQLDAKSAELERIRLDAIAANQKCVESQKVAERNAALVASEKRHWLDEMEKLQAQIRELQKQLKGLKAAQNQSQHGIRTSENGSVRFMPIHGGSSCFMA
jgi:chromosome segregation ATPase